MPTEIELLLLAWANVRKNLGREDRDVPPYDDTIADAIEDIDIAMDQLRQMFEDPVSSYEMGLDDEAEDTPDILAILEETP